MVNLPVHPLLQRLGIELPLVQAPMAGVSTPALAAAVCNAGALGSIAVGASDARSARAAITELQSLTDRPFSVNVFVHKPARADPSRERAWLLGLAPMFARYGALPPQQLHEIYTTFAQDDAMLDVLLASKPAVVSFHFGLPGADRIAALKHAGIRTFATATNSAETEAAVRSGVDAIVAQGYEAGGHRGCFDPHAHDERLGTLALVRMLAAQTDLPIVAAGGIMNGAGIVAALRAGAVAAQLGTAFVGCPESSADDAYRATLFGPGAAHTVMTRAISGRPARCLPNRFTALEASLGPDVPDYPIAYDAGKALHAAARARGEYGFGAQWAGEGAPLARSLPAARLVGRLHAEIAEASLTNAARDEL